MKHEWVSMEQPGHPHQRPLWHVAGKYGHGACDDGSSEYRLVGVVVQENPPRPFCRNCRRWHLPKMKRT